MSSAVSLIEVCAALGDPTRLAMVERLAAGPASISELAAPHAMTLTAARKHVGVLVGAGWIERRKTGRVVTCRLRREPLARLDAWVGDHRAFWTVALDRLDEVVDDAEER